jgi:hypothetical protein
MKKRYTGIVYNFDSAPIQEDFDTRKEAKTWCSENATFEDCVWIVMKDGVMLNGGIIDNMWECDEDQHDDSD